MATIQPYFLLMQLLFVQNVFSQIVPIGNGCFCQKPPVPQNQVINLQIPNPGCNCQNNLPYNVPVNFNNVPINNLPVNQLPVVNGIINNGAQLNKRPQYANIPNFNLPMGNLPIINNLPLNNVPVYNNMPVPNMPVANLPVFNNLLIGNNLPVNNIPQNGLQINRLPAFNNINIGNNMPVRNNLPIPNTFIPGMPVANNIPVNCLNGNGLVNLQNCIQMPNTVNLPIPSNIQFKNINPPQNFNVQPVNNLVFAPPSNFQIPNLPIGQPNSIQFTDVPSGIQLNQVPMPNGFNQQNYQNGQINSDCSCNQPSMPVVVENGLANQPNSGPIVSMNGLQLGGLGGLGNLPLFNGLPVIGVQESVVNLNPQCNCQN